MKTTVKTEKVAKAYGILSTARFSKMEDADKIKVWKIGRALKPVADKFKDESEDAAEKMKPEGFDEKYQKAQEYERVMRDKGADASKPEMGAAEYSKFVTEVQSYNRLVADAVKEYAEKEVELEFEPLPDETFEKLMVSNEWTLEQALELGMLIIG